MKIYDTFQQRSEEWFNIRKGKFTASNAQAIAANGKGLETYVYEILAGKYSVGKEEYINADMQRGIDLEEQAILTYSIEESVEVDLVGFVESHESIGCSPDGLIGENGGIEVKCPNDIGFLKLMLNGEKEIDTKYIWQCQMCLLITGREYWDLVFYNPNFQKNMLIFKQTPNKEMQDKLELGLAKGIAMLKDLDNKYNQLNK